MRLLNLMLGKHLGGIEQAALDYARALAPQHELLTLLAPQAAIIPAFDQRKLAVQPFAQRGWWDIRAALRLRRLLHSFQPDAILCHGNRALRLAVRASLGHVPVVAIAHNYQFKHAYKASAGFGITRELTQKLIQSGLAKSQCFHQPNFVAPEHFREKPRQLYRTSPVIGAMGRFVAKKGFADYLNALALLKAQGHIFTALLGGGGEEETALRAQAAELGLEETLTFTGWVEDKRAFFDALDIFCLPSRHEPFGIVLLEAMVARLPIVSTASEGPSEIGTHETLRFAAVARPESLAAALASLLEGHFEARALGETAWRAAHAYSYEEGAKRVNAALAVITHPGAQR